MKIENRNEPFPGNIPDGIGVGHWSYYDGEPIHVYVEAVIFSDNPPGYQGIIYPPLTPVVHPPSPPSPPTHTPIPEPGTFALLLLAFVLFILTYGLVSDREDR